MPSPHVQPTPDVQPPEALYPDIAPTDIVDYLDARNNAIVEDLDAGMIRPEAAVTQIAHK